MQDTSSQTQATQKTMRSVSKVVFDLESQQDVLKLLGYVRGSVLGVSEKNKIRDLILSYVHSRSEDSYTALGALLGTINVELDRGSKEKRDTSLSPAEDRDSEKTKLSRTEETDEKSHAVEEVSMQSSPIGQTRPVPVSFGTTSTQKSEPDTFENEKNDTGRDTPSPEDKHAPVTPPTPTPAPPPVTEKLDPTQRIQEIKHYVNERIGNPVNLIDIHNEIGREYMNALLGAMKAGTSGSQEDIASAMSRLEASFDKVKVTLDQQSNIQPQSISNNSNRTEADSPPVDSLTPQSAPTATSAPSTPKHTEVTAQFTQKDAQKDQHSGLVTNERPKQKSLRDINEELKKEKSELRPNQPHIQQVSSVPPSIQPKKKIDIAPPTAPFQEVTQTHTPARSDTPEKVEVGTQDTGTDMLKEESVISDGLIEQGVEQLLSEWDLFKGSGFLGMGPGGKEHELYKRLAPLRMSVVANGRFEGAEREVTSSIQEYMKGWNYEHKIVYDPAETFEEYLRRVVRTILEQQKK